MLHGHEHGHEHPRQIWIVNPVVIGLRAMTNAVCKHQYIYLRLQHP